MTHHQTVSSEASASTVTGAPDPRRSLVAKFDALLGRIVEIPVAIIVVIEIFILLAAVIARITHTPLVWADELASILFLWLAMLGAVVAFRRNQHMRMTAIIDRLSPNVRYFFEVIATGAALAFLLFVIIPSYEYAYEESYIVTPALELINTWRAAAFPVGISLMIVFALLRLIQLGSERNILGALAMVVAIIAAFYFIGPAFRSMGNYNLLIFFVGIVAICVLSGVPIAFSFGLSIFSYIALTTHTPWMIVVSRMDEGMSHIILLAVPLFVFLGVLIEMTGMATAMVRFLASLLGHVRGGLHYVLVGAMYLVSGISGAKVADMAAVAPVLFPEMKARGAKPGDLVALLSATGAQTETIPPSLVLITIGSVTGISIAALFTGGLLPGLVLGIILCLVVRYRYRNEDLSHIKKASWGEAGRLFLFAAPAIALPFVIRFAVVEGYATATEVSTIGIAYAVIIGLIFYRQFDWSRVMPMLIDTACLSGAILFIIGAATAMAWGLTQSGFSQSLAAAMTGLPGGHITFMAVSIVAFILLGSVLEGIPAIVLFGPLMFPIARMVGIHEVHYAMVVILAMGIGLFAPPFGVGYYGACAVGRVAPSEGMKPIIGYLVSLIIGTIVIAAVPWISIGFL